MRRGKSEGPGEGDGRGLDCSEMEEVQSSRLAGSVAGNWDLWLGKQKPSESYDSDSKFIFTFIIFSQGEDKLP